MENRKLLEQVEKLEPEMIDTLMELIRIPAIGPENNGDGEYEKAQTLLKMLADVGFDKIENYEAVDLRVPSGKRPNIVAYYNYEQNLPRIWVVTHLDVVPSGEESLWTVTKAFKPTLKDQKIYGRGSEDNGQPLVSSIYAVKALKQSKIKTKRTLALAFVSDEEQGSTMGIQHLINQGIFRKDDLILVPDSGTPEGDFIEIAEKSILWFKIVTIGKQAHSSLPDRGLNAHRIGMQVALEIDTRLHSKYNLRDENFNEPTSTFEPTRKEKNVDAINIIPGEDISYFDCRILPNYSIEEVLADINNIIKEFKKKTSATIKIEIIQKQVAAESPDTNNIVTLLKKALKETRNIDAKVGGIGGGTCAAFFRKKGIPAVVWSTIDEVAHQSNEYAKVQNMVEDAKVFALLSII